MGGNSSSRLDPFQSDDGEGVTVVKGIRLTDRVIDRMKESPQAAIQRPQVKKQARPLNPVEPWTPGERLVPIVPLCPSYASSLVPPPLREPMPPPVPFNSKTQETPAPPPPADSSTPTVEAISPSSSTESLTVTTAAPVNEVVTPQPVELLTTTSSSDGPASAPIPTAPVPEPVAVTENPPSSDAPCTAPAPTTEEPVPFPPPVTAEPVQIPLDTTALEELVPAQSSSALAIPSELPFLGKTGPLPTEETPAAEPDVPPVPPLLNDRITPLACPSEPQAVVIDEELRKQIRDKLQKHLQEEIKTAKLKIQQQLEEEKAKAEAEAQARAQLQIQAEVEKVLEREQQALQQSLKDAVMKERLNTENERLVAQYYIQKVQEKEKDLAKQDSLYREQISKLEEKTAQFTRVAAESFKKGLEDAHNRFNSRKSQIRPVCSELQSEILKCYRENTGRTLTCSNIASLYMQCVDNAKQNKKVSTGG
ncbi:coiled-coil-helix-coiled-coil-helix domain containing 3b [Salminus brasiliensis]|uniref:coiled-coil-helix-coiled-coil-helix domain containing 3b n=1 Tax=Salminus brasiliensis TaxID=930266 RepID=UPI003B832931